MRWSSPSPGSPSPLRRSGGLRRRDLRLRRPVGGQRALRYRGRQPRRRLRLGDGPGREVRRVGPPHHHVRPGGTSTASRCTATRSTPRTRGTTIIPGGTTAGSISSRRGARSSGSGTVPRTRSTTPGVLGPIRRAASGSPTAYNERVRSFWPNGTASVVLGTGEGSDLYHPWDVAVNATGYIFVTAPAFDNLGHACWLTVYRPNGSVAAGWGRNGTAPGELDWPHGITVDAAGNVFVADTGTTGSRSSGPTAPSWPPSAGIATRPSSAKVVSATPSASPWTPRARSSSRTAAVRLSSGSGNPSSSPAAPASRHRAEATASTTT